MSGQLFQDAAFAPEMVIVPPGSFMMGSPMDEYGRSDYEGPQHEVSITDYRLAVGRYAVTCEQFAYFCDVTNYDVPDRAHTYENGEWKERENRSFRNPGFEQSPRHPVVCVSWYDAQYYLSWLTEVTGFKYTLLSEAEWEYVCRAGTKTRYSSGEDISHNDANYGYHINGTVPVDSYAPNPWGLYNLHGNVREWCDDSWHDSYEDAPRDGRSRDDDDPSGDLSRVVRGGSWNNRAEFLRSAHRSQFVPRDRSVSIGFRVAREV